MRRQEVLLNLTLLVIIGALIFAIYESREMPRGLDELAVAPVTTAKAGKSGKSGRNADDDGSTGSARSKNDDADGKQIADAGENRGGQFGTKNLFRALLTPTPTPPPPTPTPAPTPDIGKALGTWRLLSVYEGKAMIEDVQKSAKGEEGAIFEIPPGGTKQVDVGGGIMKTATLNGIDDENPYNPEVTFGLESTSAVKKINLDTVPAGAEAAPAPKK